MLSTTLASMPTVNERWAAIRQVFLDKVWIGLLLMALVAVPNSVSRMLFTGWRPVYAVHLFFMTVIIGGFLLRNHLGYRTRCLMAIVMLDITAAAGILSFGLLGSAWWWMFVASLLTSMFFTIRAGLIHAAVAMGVLSLAAAGYIQGFLTIGFDANVYITEPSSWATLLTGPALLTVFVFWAVGTFQEATQALLKEVDEQREEKSRLVAQLEQSLAEIKTLRGFIPICAHCKKIRDDEGYWESVETFMQRHADVKFTHALCPPCGVALYGEQWIKAMQSNLTPPEQG